MFCNASCQNENFNSSLGNKITESSHVAWALLESLNSECRCTVRFPVLNCDARFSNFSFIKSYRHTESTLQHKVYIDKVYIEFLLWRVAVLEIYKDNLTLT